MPQVPLKLPVRTTSHGDSKLAVVSQETELTVRNFFLGGDTKSSLVGKRIVEQAVVHLRAASGLAVVGGTSIANLRGLA